MDCGLNPLPRGPNAQWVGGDGGGGKEKDGISQAEADSERWTRRCRLQRPSARHVGERWRGQTTCTGHVS